MVVREIIKSLFKSVWSESAWERVRQIRWHLWDMWHDVETTRPADIAMLTVVGNNREHAINYAPSGSVRTVLKMLQIDYYKYSFIDFGSGKGRVLLEASAFPFNSIEGVEFSIELHRIAENNIRKFRGANIQCGMIKSILADATEFRLPLNPLVVYFFNPFSGPVMVSVINNIYQSLLAYPRDIIVICGGTWMVKESLDCVPNNKVLWMREDCTVFRLHNLQTGLFNT